MKIRKDFVTNSSSSSYVCEICNYTESGFDLCLEDCGLCSCVEGHTFCVDHLEFNKENINKVIKSKSDGILSLEELDDDLSNTEILVMLINKNIINHYGEIPKEFCPICSFNKISNYMREMYIYKKYKTDCKTIIDKEIKNRFNDFEDFANFLFTKK